MWSLSSGVGPVDGIELQDQFERVLDDLHPLRDRLWKLADAGYTMDWFCYVGSHAAERAVELPRDLMQRLLDLPGVVFLDIYDDHDVGPTGSH